MENRPFDDCAFCGSPFVGVYEKLALTAEDDVCQLKGFAHRVCAMKKLAVIE